MGDRATGANQLTRTDEWAAGTLHGVSNSADVGEVAPGIRELADRCPLGLAVTRGDAFVLSYVNAAFRRLTGTDDALVLGHPLAEVLSASIGSRLIALLDQVYRTGDGQSDVEVCGTDAPAHVPCLRVTAWVAPDEHEDPRRLVIQIRDASDELNARQRRAALVDEMRAINERLVVSSLREQKLAEEAETANNAKSTFLATMSHELRTPLTAIIGYEELLVEGISGPVSDLQQVHLGRIRTAARHLLTLIDGVLTLSRAEEGREEVRREPVDVPRLLDDTGAIVLPLATAAGIRFAVRAPEAGTTLDTDRAKVGQILINLLGNAIKFTDHGEVVVAAQESGDDMVFTVSDTGIGIAAADLERVFDPFWQVEQTRTRRVGGTGLGLTVSRRLAELLGGNLSVSSAVGVGSVFSLRLPFASVGRG